MLNSKNQILFFSPVRWNSLFQRHQAFAKELAKRGYKVYFINPLNTCAYKIQIKFNQEQNINIVDIYVPFRASNIIWANFISLILSSNLLFKYKILERNLNVKKILWFADPSFAQILLIPKVRNFIYSQNIKIVYDCCDNHGSFCNQIYNTWQRYEEILLKNIDLLIVTNKKLLEKFKVYKNIIDFKYCIIPNASFVKNYYTMKIKEIDLISNSNMFYILSAGAHYEWCDFKFLDLLSDLEDVLLIIAGDGRGDEFFKLITKKRVIYFKKLSIYELYSLASCLHVGVIPFKESNTTKYVDPIKAYDYKSCGLFVWGIGPVEFRYHDMIDYYSIDASNVCLDWLEIKKRLNNYFKSKKQLANNFAKVIDIPTWSDRVNELIEKLLQIID